MAIPEAVIWILLSFVGLATLYYLLSITTSILIMTKCKLGTYFGKRQRLNNGEQFSSGHEAEYDLSSEALRDDAVDLKNDKMRTNLSSEVSPSVKTFATYSLSSSSSSSENEDDETDSCSDLDRKPAAVKKQCSERYGSAAPDNNPFLMIGSDVMVAVVSFLEPKQTLDLLTMPLCRQWRDSYTSDQELWRTVCCTEPFSADMSIYRASTDTSRSDDDSCEGDEHDSLLSLESPNALGEYRLIYTSFVRCMKYLERIQNHDNTSGFLDGNNAGVNDGSNGFDDHANRFPTFGVTKSLKRFLARSKERGLLKSVIGNGTTTITAGDIPSAPIGIASDGREIHQNPYSKTAVKSENDQKPKYGNSMITSRLWGPTANGVPSHLNLPKSCAIYSIVNWMVAHPNVRGIQTMCIKSLPSLLEDEQQRITGRRVGLVEVILCAMMRFPDHVDLHIAVFHAIVLLARPLGGREGMLYDNSMAETTQNIGLTSLVELSDSASLASRCGGLPGRKSSNQFASRTAAYDNDSSSTDFAMEKTKQAGTTTGISLLVDSMERFPDSEKLQSMACWALVNVALVPLQKNLLMRLGGIEAILNAMERHSTSFDVQFRALFALINLAVPCRESDFLRISTIDGADATRVETDLLSRLGPSIARLSVAAMKNFCSNEAILNRGCLVVHNLSQSSEFMATLLETPHCYQILEWCVTNHSADTVLHRSVSSTLQRMRFYLDQRPEEQRRFSMSLERQNRETLDQFQ